VRVPGRVTQLFGLAASIPAYRQIDLKQVEIGTIPQKRRDFPKVVSTFILKGVRVWLHHLILIIKLESILKSLEMQNPGFPSKSLEWLKMINLLWGPKTPVLSLQDQAKEGRPGQSHLGALLKNPKASVVWVVSVPKSATHSVLSNSLFLSIFVMLGIEPRVSCLLKSHALYTELHPCPYNRVLMDAPFRSEVSLFFPFMEHIPNVCYVLRLWILFF
jgi:hypothetical protein